MEIEQLYRLFLEHPTVTTDSRNVPPHSIFFALRGDKFDGNDYILQTLEAGADFAVGDSRNLPEDERIIRVDNVLQTLQALANYHRNRMSATVIGITGTNGKTTTKELIAAALSAQYNTLYTQGNLNNHIGVPLTLLQLKPEHEFAVIEMGANHSGEIQALCNIAEPNFGLITNVGKAHLEGFGSFEGVVKTKTELYEFLSNNGGVAFANLDNQILNGLYTSLKRVSYGSTAEAFIRGHITASAPVLALDWGQGGGELTTHLVGAYNFENVLAAICVATYFGVSAEKINRAIADYIPTNNRSQQLKTARNNLIVDAYNANPSSMQAALDNFNGLDVTPKMVILGEMRELGQYSEEEHQKVIAQLQQLKLDRIFLIGEKFISSSTEAFEQPHASPSFGEGRGEVSFFATTDDLITELQKNPISGYHILIKGSRGNHLEQVIPYV